MGSYRTEASGDVSLYPMHRIQLCLNKWMLYVAFINTALLKRRDMSKMLLDATVYTRAENAVQSRSNKTWWYAPIPNDVGTFTHSIARKKTNAYLIPTIATMYDWDESRVKIFRIRERISWLFVETSCRTVFI